MICCVCMCGSVRCRYFICRTVLGDLEKPYFRWFPFSSLVNAIFFNTIPYDLHASGFCIYFFSSFFSTSNHLFSPRFQCFPLFIRPYYCRLLFTVFDRVFLFKYSVAACKFNICTKGFECKWTLNPFFPIILLHLYLVCSD